MAKNDPPSRQVLDAIPARVLRFTLGVSTNEGARLALMTRGYNQDHQSYALGLVMKLNVMPATAQTNDDKEARSAIVELDAWDEPNFAAIEAAVAHTHPEQAAFLFKDGLEPAEGLQAVVGVGILLDRIDELAKGRSPESTDKDKAVVALLASRSYTDAERARLRALIAKTSTVKPVQPLSDTEQNEIKLSLWRWFNDWSKQANAATKKRSHLIALGLASRQERKKAKKEEAASGDAKTPAGGAKPA